MSSSRKIKRIALIVPLDDFGIQTYTYELAEGLAANGVEVDVYKPLDAKFLPSHLPMHHNVFPVLGSFLFRQASQPGQPAGKDVQADTAKSESKNEAAPARPGWRSNKRYLNLRKWLLDLEVCLHLRKKNYDVVWTQWHDVNGFHFWSIADICGLPLAHTVHNVLPHEETPEDFGIFKNIYQRSSTLFVHSNFSRNELLTRFPSVESSKIHHSWHGTYTAYERAPKAREEVRRRWNIGEGQLVLLCAGGVRPYKNVDTVMRGLKLSGEDVVLVVSGKESGFPNSTDDDPLRETQRLVEELGMQRQVRLEPGFAGFEKFSEMAEAADILGLAYQMHYGSGMLCLGMTFGLHILATNIGGSDEYLQDYPSYTIIESATPELVAKGISAAVKQIKKTDRNNWVTPECFQWKNIAAKALKVLSGV